MLKIDYHRTTSVKWQYSMLSSDLHQEILEERKKIPQNKKTKEIILSGKETPTKQTNEATLEKVPVVFWESQTSPAHRACVTGKWKKTIPHASYSQYNSSSSFCLRALMSILLVWIKGVLSHLAISRRAIVHKSIHGMALLFQSISIILLAASATLRSHLFSHLFKLCSELVNSNTSTAAALSKLISRTNSIYLRTSFQKLAVL